MRFAIIVGVARHFTLSIVIEVYDHAQAPPRNLAALLLSTSRLKLCGGAL